MNLERERERGESCNGSLAGEQKGVDLKHENRAGLQDQTHFDCGGFSVNGL